MLYILNLQSLSLFLGQTLDNQSIGVIDQLFQELFIHIPLYHHRVPVLFIHVIAGNDGRIDRTKLQRIHRIAFEIDRQRLFIHRQRKYFPRHTIDPNFLIKRIIEYLAFFREEIGIDV